MVNGGLSRHLSGAGITELELRVPGPAIAGTAWLGHANELPISTLATVSPDHSGGGWRRC